MRPNYGDLLDEVKIFGEEVSSRHGPTREQLGVTYRTGPGEMPRRDNINYTIGYIEAIQLLAGVFAPHMYKELAPNSQHVLFTINMAYGPRVTLQVPRIIETLRQDPNSRQAIIFVGKPEDGPTNDQPCTTSIQLLQRGSRLVSVVGMRSNDLVKGLPYDVMMFSALNMAVAHCLELYPGWTQVNVGSGHVYERDQGRQAKQSTVRFRLRSDLPRSFAGIRDIAYDQMLRTDDWSVSEYGKHLVPPIFIEEAAEEGS